MDEILEENFGYYNAALLIELKFLN